MGVNPLYIENFEKDIPLVLSLRRKHDDCGVMLSKETFPLVVNYSLIPLYKKCLPVAMDNGCLSSAKMILERILTHDIGNLGDRLHGAGITNPVVRKMANHLTVKYPVKQIMINSEDFEKFLEVLPRFHGKNHKDSKTILKEAVERGEDWLVRLALKSDIHLVTESAPAWQLECDKGYFSTLLVFLEVCDPEKFMKICKDENILVSTRWFEHSQNMDYFKLPLFKALLNKRDKHGRTPLHHAIQRDDLELTKALLEIEGIDVSIKDKNGKTAIDLLQKHCRFSPSWGKMCEEIKQHSALKELKYLFWKISFEGMKNTMSVVAALVATITFAAGFTVPGGLDSKDGTPVLATKAAFLVFSVSNTIASMCCSIMVLFILLGPMMWDPYPSLIYVNLSLSLLLMSLGGTMVAFITGVYATMVTKAKWEAIFVIVSCSSILFMACIVMLLIYLSHFQKLLSKPYIWFKKIFMEHNYVNGWTSFIATANSSQQPAWSSNKPMSQFSDSTMADVQPGSSDTVVPIASGDTMAVNVQSGISNTLVTEVSSSPLTERHTPRIIMEVGQSSGTSYLAPNDIKIEIKHN
ncbi:uncharacterized protein LOC141606518 [Silene latifolia]|uniref:uncharacterized protein LOC141606518 n=1 Tax=Silene latifolia TaxID=37657 RepID=UPI003D77CDA4